MATVRWKRWARLSLHVVVTGVPFVVIFLLSPELGIRFANRFMEAIMDKQESRRRSADCGLTIGDWQPVGATPCGCPCPDGSIGHRPAPDETTSPGRAGQARGPVPTRIAHPKSFTDYHLTRNAWRVVRFFRKTPRTEEAFYLRFQRLGAPQRRLLKDGWKLADDWALYRRLCRFWGVGAPVRRADRKEQGYWDLDDRQKRFPFAEEEAA